MTRRGRRPGGPWRTDVDTRAAGTARPHLGNLLAERFERSGQRVDLDAAVTVLRAAEAMVG